MNAKLKVPSAEESYKKTQSRLEAIQSHFTNAPRGSKLKGKVCIITGVGSLKGIGYADIVFLLPSFLREFIHNMGQTVHCFLLRSRR